MGPGLEGSELLRVCLDRLEWPPERLAREVNRIAGQQAITQKAPYGWLKGSTPRGRLPQFVALALSRALGETISPAALFPDARGGAVAVAAHHGLDLPWTSEGALCCAALLSAPTGNALLAASGPMLVACAVDWLTVPDPEAPTRLSGTPLDPEFVYVLAERIIQLRRLDDTQSSPLVLDLVVHDLHLAADLATSSSYDRQTGTALFGVLAELAQLAGWVSIDLDKKAQGQRFLLAALHFAHASGDRDFAANILSCLGYQTLWTGDGASAVRLIRLARQGTLHTAHPLVAALLASREGRAHAIQGELAACARALDEATASFTALDPHTAPTPTWAYWINEGVLAADAGRAWLEANDPGRSAKLLSRGLELLGSDQPRNRLLHGISLAHAHLRVGNLDDAVMAGEAALDVARIHGSIRVRSRLDQLRGELTAQPSSDARRLADHIADLVGA